MREAPEIDKASSFRPLAVVTGASRGIGAEYARALAERGYNLLLVARDQARLETVATTLSAQYAVDIELELLDLSQPGAAQRLYSAASARAPHTRLLINNAGFGLYGPFVTHPLSKVQEMLRLHINTVVESIRLFLPSMVEARTGAIINVASVAGFFSLPYMAEYAATKTFLITFSEALAEEVRPFGVHIQACCPGYTATDFHRTAGVSCSYPLPAQCVQHVVAASLRALHTSRVCVPVGWQGRILRLVSRLMPSSLVSRMSHIVTRRRLAEASR
ncbi:MAG: SDR family oxidoreductase [Nitrospirae bacterium]|nr:MAG: SDR family oxidoreductase [Nitrospirota bacterium]